MKPLVVVMIDGLGAEEFANNRHRLPNLHLLADNGCLIQTLEAQRCATSMPGRVSTLTGVSSETHGIYGNVIWDGDCFRNTNHLDVRVDALDAHANGFGRTVANMGFGMVGPENCIAFHPPYWGVDMRHNTAQYGAADAVWTGLFEATVTANRMRELTDVDLSHVLPVRRNSRAAEDLTTYQRCDEQLMCLVAALVNGKSAPDLVLAEIAAPDYFLHRFGVGSPEATRAICDADALIGEFIRPSKARKNDFNLAVVTDHGFSNISESIHPDVILPGASFACEGGTLHLRTESDRHCDEAAVALAVHGVERIDSGYLPPDQRGMIASFAAPHDCDFYSDWDKTGLPRSPSKYCANHGFRAGHSGDQRFAIFFGPDIGPATIEHAGADVIAPTLAALLEIPTASFPMRSIL